MTNRNSAANRAEGPAKVPTDDQIESLGVPTYIALDTSYIESQSFNFFGNTLGPFVMHAATNNIHVLIPEVVKREVESRIRDRVAQAKSAYKSFRDKIAVIRSIPNHPLAGYTDDEEFARNAETLISLWHEFLHKSAATILRFDEASLADVMDGYFDVKAPFEMGAKKSEFPDAVIVSSLRNFAKANRCKVALVTDDNGLRLACEQSKELVAFDDTAPLLGSIIQAREVTVTKLNEGLRLRQPDIDKSVKRALPHCYFGLATDEYEDIEIDVDSEFVIDKSDYRVVGLTKTHAVIAGTVQISAEVAVVFKDPSRDIEDPETGQAWSWGWFHGDLHASAQVEVTFRSPRKSLQRGRLYINQLNVGRNNEVILDGCIHNVRNEYEEHD